MDNRRKEFEAFVEKIMESYDAAGMAVSVFDSESTLYENFFGYRDADRKLLLNEDTIFGMASVSKSFTALAIMQMEEKGLLSTEDAVHTYIPEFEDLRVTIAHLLTHSAGYFPLKRILVKDVAEELGIYDGGNRELGYDKKLADRGLDLVCERLNGQKIRLCEPGRYMSYSNDCYGILSEIIRRFGGEASYGEYIKKHIFEPMGMERSFCEFIRPSRDENGTELYIHRNGVREHDRDFYDNAFVLMGGGAVKSTVRDMKKYVRMYMGEGLTPSGDVLVGRGKILKMCMPRQEYHYGQWYGYGLSQKRIGGLTIWGHGGSLTGISNYMAWEPRLCLGVLVFCNTTRIPASHVADMAFRWITGMGLEEEPFLPTIPWSRELQKKAEGLYESGEGVQVRLTVKDEGIYMEAGGQPVPCRMILPGILETSAPLVTDDLILMENDAKEVFGVRFRGRILPRAENGTEYISI